MGPMLLLDKSALECLNENEAVWLDMFFGANIVPLFYVETLADLEKSDKTNRTSEKIVADIAKKTPVNATFPNAYHKELVIQDLFGNHPPIDTHQVVVAQGEVRKDSEGKLGHHIEEFAEQAALNRWFRGDFSDLERNFAKGWREALNSLDPETTTEWVKNLVPKDRKFSTVDDVKAFADEFVRGSGLEVLNFALQLLGVPRKLVFTIQKRYIAAGQPPLEDFAPYASFVLKVDIFYYLCLRSSFISGDRASNKVDIAYLYYLPFCHAFVSKDRRLHKRVAHLFMENHQRFVDAEDFKKALKQADEHYVQYAEEIEKVGLMRFAVYPDPAMNNLIVEMWDEFMRPDWREVDEKRKQDTDDMPRDKDIVKKLNKQRDEAKRVSGPIDKSKIDYAMVGRKMGIRKGKWRMLPPEFDNIKE